MIGTNEPTRYEIVAEKGDRQVLIAYSAARSFSALLRSLTSRVNAVDAVFGSLEVKRGNTAADGVTLGDGWHVHFSGRTQRDVYNTATSHSSLIDMARSGIKA